MTTFESLPTELIGHIADHLDNATLISLRTTSPSLRAQASHEYGKRFFSDLYICTNLIGLQALKDIATSPDFAKHVRTLTFSWCMALTDPLHDEQVKRGYATHTSPSGQPAKSDHDLHIARIRANALTIAQSLPNLPRLVQITCGDPSIDDSPNQQHFLGARQRQNFSCPFGHCSTARLHPDDEAVLESISLAITHAKIPNHVRLGYIRGYRFTPLLPTQMHMTSSPSSTSRISYQTSVNDTFAQRSWSLYFSFSITNDTHAYTAGWSEWQNSNIQALTVTYPRNSQHHPFRSEIGLGGLPLANLEEVSLENLRTENVVLDSFLRNSLRPGNVKRVELVRCSVFTTERVVEDEDGEMVTGCWRGVIRTLRGMRNLMHLRLEGLECNVHLSLKRIDERNECLNNDMAVEGTWTSREEVRRGLDWLVDRYGVIFQRTDGEERGYVNLRWANVKAAPQIYAFTNEEKRKLKGYRFRTWLEGQDLDIEDDERVFPSLGFDTAIDWVTLMDGLGIKSLYEEGWGRFEREEMRWEVCGGYRRWVLGIGWDEVDLL